MRDENGALERVQVARPPYLPNPQRVYCCLQRLLPEAAQLRLPQLRVQLPLPYFNSSHACSAALVRILYGKRRRQNVLQQSGACLCPSKVALACIRQSAYISHRCVIYACSLVCFPQNN